MVQGVKAQASWDEVYTMTNTTSADWTQLNAGSTTGQTIGAAGTTTYCYADANLTFTDATSIKAGQAYLIKWDGGSNLGPSDLVFTGVNLAKDLCDDEITAD